jgi:maltose O-acetyltransferase
MIDSPQNSSDDRDPSASTSISARIKDLWRLEFSNFRWRLMVIPLLARLLPQRRARLLRTVLIRAIGLNIGSGTRFSGMPVIQSSEPGSLWPRLRIGENCEIGINVILEFAETVTIGDRVTLADGAVVMTTTHELGPKEHRAGTFIRSPVSIGNDVRIGENAIILPGAIIGDAAQVMPGSVVNARVAPGITVSGIPARPLRAPNG